MVVAEVDERNIIKTLLSRVSFPLRFHHKHHVWFLQYDTHYYSIAAINTMAANQNQRIIPLEDGWDDVKKVSDGKSKNIMMD